MADLPEPELEEEQLLQLAIEYATTGVYLAGLSKDKKELCTARQVH